MGSEKAGKEIKEEELCDPFACSGDCSIGMEYCPHEATSAGALWAAALHPPIKFTFGRPRVSDRGVGTICGATLPPVNCILPPATLHVGQPICVPCAPHPYL